MTAHVRKRSVPQREKTDLLTRAPNKNSNQPVHLRSLIARFDQSLRYQHCETLLLWQFKMRLLKILVRLRMRRLIWMLTKRKRPRVRFLTLRVISDMIFSPQCRSRLTSQTFHSPLLEIPNGGPEMRAHLRVCENFDLIISNVIRHFFLPLFQANKRRSSM